MELAASIPIAAIRPGRGAEGLSGATPETRWRSRPASDLSLEQLAGNASLTEAQKIAEGARQFEALLLRQILQESQKTVFQSKFTDNSTAAGIYRDLVTQQLAESISKSGSLGLAKSLEGQLQAQRTSSAGQNPVPTAPPTAPRGGDAARPPFGDAPLGAASSKCLPPARGVATDHHS